MIIRDKVSEIMSNLKIRHFIAICWILLLTVIFGSVTAVGASQVMYFRDYFTTNCVELLDKFQNEKLEIAAM